MPPVDANGVIVEALEQLISEHQPKLVYLIPTFGNPSGATLSLERRRRVLELAVQSQDLGGGRRYPYWGDMYS